MEKIERIIYGKHWFLLHILISLLLVSIISLFIIFCGLEFNGLLAMINESTVSLSAAIAGFVFAGMSIFISMEGSKKMADIKSIGKVNIIYSILISSIVFFVVSLLFMLVRINLLNITPELITNIQYGVKLTIEWGSLFCFLLGFIFFFSSLKLIYWIFK